MRRTPVLFAFVILAVTCLIAASTLAQGGPPPPDASPGAPGVTGPELGLLEPAAAPGYRLRMVETVLAPGAYVTRHIHAAALIVCVQSGAFGFAIQEGAATLTRGGSGDTPETT